MAAGGGHDAPLARQREHRHVGGRRDVVHPGSIIHTVAPRPRGGRRARSGRSRPSPRRAEAAGRVGHPGSRHRGISFHALRCPVCPTTWTSPRGSDRGSNLRGAFGARSPGASAPSRAGVSRAVVEHPAALRAVRPAWWRGASDSGVARPGAPVVGHRVDRRLKRARAHPRGARASHATPSSATSRPVTPACVRAHRRPRPLRRREFESAREEEAAHERALLLGEGVVVARRAAGRRHLGGSARAKRLHRRGPPVARSASIARPMSRGLGEAGVVDGGEPITRARSWLPASTVTCARGGPRATRAPARPRRGLPRARPRRSRMVAHRDGADKAEPAVVAEEPRASSAARKRAPWSAGLRWRRPARARGRRRARRRRRRGGGGALVSARSVRGTRASSARRPGLRKRWMARGRVGTGAAHPDLGGADRTASPERTSRWPRTNATPAHRAARLAPHLGPRPRLERASQAVTRWTGELVGLLARRAGDRRVAGDRARLPLLRHVAARDQHGHDDRNVPDGVPIQRAQNKDAMALHLKLNELVAAVQGRATGSSTSRTSPSTAGDAPRALPGARRPLEAGARPPVLSPRWRPPRATPGSSAGPRALRSQAASEAGLPSGAPPGTPPRDHQRLDRRPVGAVRLPRHAARVDAGERVPCVTSRW